jgi:hypothetical protein
MRQLVVVAALLLGRVAAAPQWTSRPAIHGRQPGFFRSPPVMESSGLTMSRSFPGRFWTLNDSSNPNTLYLVDSTASVRGLVQLGGATNLDWEAISSGPCAGRWCLYVGDIGDNRAVRRSVVIYRLVEPTMATLDPAVAPVEDSIVVTYPDGPHDAEALVITAAEDLVIITKGREGHPHAYRVGARSWGRGRAVAELDWELPLRSSLLLASLVTDAALSADETTLAVRTYRDIHLFQRGDRSRVLPDRPAVTCRIDPSDPIGEGIAWWNDSTLVLTSEANRWMPGPVTLLQCPIR